MQILIDYIRTILKTNHEIDLKQDLSLMFGGESLYLIDANLNRIGTIYIDMANAVYIHNDENRTNFVMLEEYAVKTQQIHDEMGFNIWKQTYLLVGESSPEHLITIDSDATNVSRNDA